MPEMEAFILTAHRYSYSTLLGAQFEIPTRTEVT